MEMLDRVHALQRAPVAKPDHVLLSAHARERAPDEAVQFSSRFRQQIIGHWIGRRGKLGPDDEMHDPPVDSVRPIVEQDLVVFFEAGRIDVSNLVPFLESKTAGLQLPSPDTYPGSRISLLQPSSLSSLIFRPAQSA